MFYAFLHFVKVDIKGQKNSNIWTPFPHQNLSCTQFLKTQCRGQMSAALCYTLFLFQQNKQLDCSCYAVKYLYHQIKYFKIIQQTCGRDNSNMSEVNPNHQHINHYLSLIIIIQYVRSHQDNYQLVSHSQSTQLLNMSLLNYTEKRKIKHLAIKLFKDLSVQQLMVSLH